MDATSIKLEGNSMENLAREMVTFRSSNGCRITSSVFCANSGNSSRNNTPRCASDTSPGLGMPPPPTNAAALAGWRILYCTPRAVASGAIGEMLEAALAPVRGLATVSSARGPAPF